MDDRDREIVLRTYNSVWKMDRKIYSIQGLKLLFPIAMNEALFFGISFALTFLLLKIIPPLNNLHFILKYIVLPFGMMKAFTSIKLDGKKAYKFIYDYVLFKFGPRALCRFTSVDGGVKKLRFNSNTIYRESKVIDKTEEAIKVKGRRKK